MRAYRILPHLALLAGVCAAQTTYTYDSGGHLTKINYGASGSIVYGYDAAGHLTNRTVVAAGGTGSTITEVNTTSGGTDVAQNTFIEIYGINLVPTSTPAGGVIWSTAPSFANGQMPTQLNGVSVTVNSKPAYVYFFCSAATSPVCSSDQLDVLTPLDNTTGPVQIVVTNGTTSSAPFSANLKTVAPTFIRLGGTNYVAAEHADGSLIGPTTLYPGASTPAAPEEEVQIYAVGFGLPSTALTAGSSKQSGSLATLPLCTVGNNSAAVAFAGLIGAGLYQLNVVIPASTPNGDNSIVCTYAGSSTQAADLITVHQ